jgi:hypothetical protein
MEVAEELEARDYVDVPLAPVGNDPSNLILREPAFRIDERKSF